MDNSKLKLSITHDIHITSTTKSVNNDKHKLLIESYNICKEMNFGSDRCKEIKKYIEDMSK